MSFTDRFTGRAAAYVAARPSYPPEVVDALIAGLGEPEQLAVADLGAGTGISSRVIAARGPRVFAVEPNAAMRSAGSGGERVMWIDGTAERTTLAPGSVDVVVGFQAWHWFDCDATVAEARRIARPGGRIAAIYNERDPRDPFTAAFGEIVHRYAVDDTEERRFNALRYVTTIDPATTERFDFPYLQRLDRAGVHTRVESSSYLPQTGEAATAMHADLDRLVDGYETPDGVVMHLVTMLVRADL